MKYALIVLFTLGTTSAHSAKSTFTCEEIQKVLSAQSASAKTAINPNEKDSVWFFTGHVSAIQQLQQSFQAMCMDQQPTP